MHVSVCLCLVRKKTPWFQSFVESFGCLSMTCTIQPRLHTFTSGGGGPAPFTTCVLGYPSQRLFMKKMSHYYMQSAKNPAHLLPKNFALHVWKQNLEYPERQVVQCVPIPYYIPTMVCTNGILVLQLIYSNMQFCTNRKLHNTHTVALKAICFPRI